MTGMRRRIIGLMAGLVWLAACTSPAWRKPIRCRTLAGQSRRNISRWTIKAFGSMPLLLSRWRGMLIGRKPAWGKVIVNGFGSRTISGSGRS